MQFGIDLVDFREQYVWASHFLDAWTEAKMEWVSCLVNEATECIKNRKIIQGFWPSSKVLSSLYLLISQKRHIYVGGEQKGRLGPMRTLKDQMESQQVQPQKHDKLQFLQSQVGQLHLCCEGPEASLYLSWEQPNTWYSWLWPWVRKPRLNYVSRILFKAVGKCIMHSQEYSYAKWLK